MRSIYPKAMMAVVSVVTAAGFVASADPANAEIPASPKAIAPTSDLNLASPQGRSAAERRIHTAADRVCACDGNLLGPNPQCDAKAIDEADAALDAMIVAR